MRDISVDDGYSPPKRIVRPGVLLTIAGLGIAVVGLGILALPACGCSYRGKAHMAAMKSDLKNLASQQEIYYSDEYSFTTVVSDLAFTNSDGVIVTIGVSEDGWTAKATHVAWGTEVGCAIFYGGIDWVMRTPGGGVPPTPGDVFCDEPR